MVQYHFPAEATQIAALMQTVPQEGDEPAQRGMSEQDASFAVLGVDIEAIGVAVARHWGLADEVIHMMRRLPTTRPVRNPDGDADLLRIGASAANEAVDAINLLMPAARGQCAQYRRAALRPRAGYHAARSAPGTARRGRGPARRSEQVRCRRRSGMLARDRK